MKNYARDEHNKREDFAVGFLATTTIILSAIGVALNAAGDAFSFAKHAYSAAFTNFGPLTDKEK